MWLSERRGGGRGRALVFLLHPGPSLLVTATFVGLAWLARRSPPDAWLAVRLVLLMLPIQFAIGVANDVMDVHDDALAKPYKPLVRGVMSRAAASRLAGALAATGLVAAASISWVTLGMAALGLSAGLLYDVGLRRTPLSWLPWWGGMVALPLAAYATAGRLAPRLLVVLPLCLLLALGLHAANALPDLAADGRAGRRSLPVLLGERGSRVVIAGALAALVVLAVAVAPALGQAGPWLWASASVLTVLLVGVTVLRVERPFPVLAVGSAVLAVAWVATLRV